MFMNRAVIGPFGFGQFMWVIVGASGQVIPMARKPINARSFKTQEKKNGYKVVFRILCRKWVYLSRLLNGISNRTSVFSRLGSCLNAYKRTDVL